MFANKFKCFRQERQNRTQLRKPGKTTSFTAKKMQLSILNGMKLRVATQTTSLESLSAPTTRDNNNKYSRECFQTVTTRERETPGVNLTYLLSPSGVTNMLFPSGVFIFVEGRDEYAVPERCTGK